jgi:MOSC domain-containing protein YiiM
MENTMPWQGELLQIFVTERASAPMRALDQARLISGVGIEGDRYALGTGFYSYLPRADRQITLIEEETLIALARDHDIALAGNETRRNLLTRGVALNHLVGREFCVGPCVLIGERLNVPCKYLEEVTGKAVFSPLTNRSGLNCRILRGGIVRCGDVIAPVEQQS